ncbi:MAG: hypothetical protein K2K57_12135 [Oscillospiraceae bacterium]|nr:hypothetical protein [Oscillospiraceae bacterium]
MEKIFFTGPKYNNQIEITAENIPELYNDLIKGFPLYWKQGNYSCTFEIFTDDILQKRLRICFYEELGLGLTYEQLYDRLFKGEIRRGVKADLAVYDESKLETVVDVYFELYTSEGLLLPPELAWKGIQYFIKTGGKSPELKWITPDELPDSGNWC